MSRAIALAVCAVVLAVPPTTDAARYDVARVDVSVSPKRRSVSEGQKMTFRVTLRNRTQSKFRKVRACADFVGLAVRVCEAPFGVLRPGEAKTAKISFKPPARRTPYRVVFSAEGPQVRSTRAVARLRVRERR